MSIALIHGDNLEVSGNYENSYFNHETFDPPFRKYSESAYLIPNYSEFINERIDAIVPKLASGGSFISINVVSEYNLIREAMKRNNVPSLCTIVIDRILKYGTKTLDPIMIDIGLKDVNTKEKPVVLDWRKGVKHKAGFRRKGITNMPEAQPVWEVQILIEAFVKKGDIVFDSFCGAGTWPVLLDAIGANCVSVEQSLSNLIIAQKRLARYRDEKHIYEKSFEIVRNNIKNVIELTSLMNSITSMYLAV